MKTEFQVSDSLALNPFPDFRAASEDVLQYLHDLLGFSLWMVTRTQGEDWIVLRALDAGYGVKDGDVFRWTDSFCSRMVRGEGPQIAPVSAVVPAYAEAPIGQQVPIGAYVGVPLETDDGSLFGTLCAIDPEPQPEAVTAALPTVRLVSRLLATILSAELRVEAEQRRTEQALDDALRDPLTGLANRRAWDRFLAMEEARCQRYGHPACVFSLDLDGFKRVNDSLGHAAGDETLRCFARVMQNTCRSTDFVARLGGDEFGIVAIEADALTGGQIRTRLEGAAEEAKIPVSIGMVALSPASDLAEAFRKADGLMYRRKSERLSARAQHQKTGLVA